MRNNIKKVVISLLIIGIVATMAVGFAGCEKSLDGLYIDVPTAGDSHWAIKIEGDKFQFLSRNSEKDEFNKIEHETTFTREKDKITLAKKFSKSYDAFTITKGGNLTITYTFNGKEVTEYFQKQK